MPNANSRGRRNILTGQVVSDKMNKTISVLIYNSVKHPKYKKYIKKTSVFKAHDEGNSAKTGDVVRIFETRALSKTKRWKLLEIAQSAAASAGALDLDPEVLKKKKAAEQESAAGEKAEEPEEKA